MIRLNLVLLLAVLVSTALTMALAAGLFVWLTRRRRGAHAPPAAER